MHTINTLSKNLNY